MRNLIVINNNDVWMERVLYSLSSCFDKNLTYKQDFLIGDLNSGFLSDMSHINKDLVKNLKPYAKNIFAYCKSELICILGDKTDINLEYDNIIFLAVYIGNVLVNKKINELKIKYKRKFIIPTDDDIDRFYILKKSNKKEIFIIDEFILDCKNIICPSSLVEYMPMKDSINVLPYAFPVDFELYDDSVEENATKNFSSLEMHLFTKPQRSKDTVKILKIINRRIYNFNTVGIFPKLAFEFNEKLFNKIKECFSKISFLIILLRMIIKRKIGIILFIDNRKKDTYYSQLNTFNSFNHIFFIRIYYPFYLFLIIFFSIKCI